MAKSLTVANAVITFIIPDLFGVPFVLEGYAADDIFDTEPLKSAETSMGVDGKLSGGFVFVEVVQNYNLQANSPSIPFFDQWWLFSQQSRDTITADGEVVLTSLGTAYTLTNGFLTSYPPIPNAGKIARPRKFGVTWESVVPIPV